MLARLLEFDSIDIHHDTKSNGTPLCCAIKRLVDGPEYNEGFLKLLLKKYQLDINKDGSKGTNAFIFDISIPLHWMQSAKLIEQFSKV